MCYIVGMKATTLRMNAKCSDLFAANLTDATGKQIGEDYDGYVPAFMPGEHFGDYVELHIDLATGQILNWKKPTEAALKVAFKEC